MDEVRELDLGDGNEAVERGADGHAHDPRFSERRVQHARLAELRVETIGGAEHAAFAPDVFAHDEHALVAVHLFADGRAYCLDHPHLSHALGPSRTTFPPPRGPPVKTPPRPLR